MAMYLKIYGCKSAPRNYDFLSHAGHVTGPELLIFIIF
jgi:hypothetical protein